MLDALKKLFSRPQPQSQPSPQAALPDGQRIYAIGDVHGRLDLFLALITAIEADDAARGFAQTTIILLGDLVDRGADSAGVLQAARALQQRRNVRILCGNHEEMMLKSMEELEVFRHFLRHGGRETIQSFGVPVSAFAGLDLDEMQSLLKRSVPPSEVAFIQGFEDSITVGDYLFVHAGVAPGVPLEEQKSSDLRWIREPFLSHPDPFGAVVVHGHTIRDEAEDRGNRIGIDTGAFQSGRLTAVVLEGTSRRFIQTQQDEGGVISVEEIVPGGL